MRRPKDKKARRNKKKGQKYIKSKISVVVLLLLQNIILRIHYLETAMSTNVDAQRTNSEFIDCIKRYGIV